MGNVSVTNELSSRPERILDFLPRSTGQGHLCAFSRKERRMKFARATKFYRKSGGA